MFQYTQIRDLTHTTFLFNKIFNELNKELWSTQNSDSIKNEMLFPLAFHQINFNCGDIGDLKDFLCKSLDYLKSYGFFVCFSIFYKN